ncbi:hypothetical protein KMZ32_06355 [Phycicoccus sp. MAQZ13P-2]|uniref:hypothetical protein n=1 Tax=Phycicoccus TaxID=367298 RepID=UPI001C0043A9|nr:hypothetical protein [Phycicoccus mangrovi]MBT9273692.1 hypothetical protein [Phycicoccus mangrovi]
MRSLVRRRGLGGAAPDRLLRHLAVHLAAERIALATDGGATHAAKDHEIVEGAEHLDDLGTGCPFFAVQLGLLPAGMLHETRSERETGPRFVTTHEAADLDHVEQLLHGCDDRVGDAVAPAPGAVFGQLRRHARRAALEWAGRRSTRSGRTRD